MDWLISWVAEEKKKLIKERRAIHSAPANHKSIFMKNDLLMAGWLAAPIEGLGAPLAAARSLFFNQFHFASLIFRKRELTQLRYFSFSSAPFNFTTLFHSVLFLWRSPWLASQPLTPPKKGNEESCLLISLAAAPIKEIQEFLLFGCWRGLHSSIQFH